MQWQSAEKYSFVLRPVFLISTWPHAATSRPKCEEEKQDRLQHSWTEEGAAHQQNTRPDSVGLQFTAALSGKRGQHFILSDAAINRWFKDLISAS